MKQKVKFKDFNGKVTEVELNIRNPFHFEIQKTNKHQIIKPSKGKGSYTRKQKHKKGYEE